MEVAMVEAVKVRTDATKLTDVIIARLRES